MPETDLERRWQGRQDSNPRPAVLETSGSMPCAPRLRNPCAVRQDRRCLDRNYSTPIMRSAPARARGIPGGIRSGSGSRGRADLLRP